MPSGMSQGAAASFSFVERRATTEAGRRLMLDAVGAKALLVPAHASRAAAAVGNRNFIVTLVYPPPIKSSKVNSYL